MAALGRTAEAQHRAGGSLGVPKRSPGYGVWASGYAATAGGRGGRIVPRRPSGGCRRVCGDGEPGARSHGERGRGPFSGRAFGRRGDPVSGDAWAADPLAAEDYNPGFPAPSGKLPRHLMLQQRTRQENRHRRTLRRVWAGQHS